MAELASLDREYKEWIRSVSQKYRQSQIKAAVSVNRELLAFYWDLGRDISEREKKWGTGFYETLSKDLQRALPDVKGFAVSNLRYVRRFFSLYSVSIQPQAVGELKEGDAEQIRPQLVGEIQNCFLFRGDITD